jgi:ankyrin repeat protein
MSAGPVRTPDLSLTIRKPVEKEERIIKSFFSLVIHKNKKDEDYDALRNIIERYGYLSNASDEEGITALMIASEMNDIKLVKLLIEKGADIDKRDKVDKSAFLYARDSKANAIRKFLMEKGASVKPSRLNKKGGARTRRRSRKSKGTRRR